MTDFITRGFFGEGGRQYAHNRLVTITAACAVSVYKIYYLEFFTRRDSKSKNEVLGFGFP